MPARILIVDDMLLSLKMLAAKLTGEHYEVLTASDGETALDIVGREEPDCVLLDVMMPGMDGFEVCRRIKGDEAVAHIPVVMVTALSDNADKINGLDAGADDFLTKPVSDATLFARVRSLVRLKLTLDQWRLRQETSSAMAGGGDERPSPLVSGTNASVVLIGSGATESGNIGDVLAGDDDAVTAIGFDEDLGKRIGELAPEVAIVNFNAGEVDLSSLCPTLRADEPFRHLPILMIGEEEDMDALVEWLGAGVSDFVLRPLDDHELLARVRCLVRRKRYQDRLRSSFEGAGESDPGDSAAILQTPEYLRLHLETVMRCARRNKASLSLVLIQIDDPPTGGGEGDAALAAIAGQLQRSLRGFDLVARHGEMCLAILMPATALDVATVVGERLAGLSGPSARIAAVQMEDTDGGADDFLKRAGRAVEAATAPSGR